MIDGSWMLAVLLTLQQKQQAYLSSSWQAYFMLR
jgi:hypothetical protein